ncbi:S9 family peptidase [Jeotgalibacillus proteolyticus]|uniref:Peptidase n=1 Tax=Jeotgalibacillus proteolyticus TaxID=2082395 RepID=A0A2S5GHB6_9BACL|nr:S9 family peptidase [Jeotgalibacillus proteolyticus]PPA72379.1 peptidase [Jeotgalibacillus proteolyticus]
MAEKRKITVEDLYSIHSVTDPRWSPQGDEVIFVKTHINPKSHTYASNLFHVDSNSGEITQWTFGDKKVSSPRWSPNGKKVAFVSNRSGKNQLYILSKTGGEARQITDTEHGAGNPVWSPCGTKLAFSVSLKKDETIPKAEEEKKEEAQDELTPFETVTMKYKADGAGLLEGKEQHIAIINIETDELVQVTSGENSYTLFDWSPDGEKLAYSTNNEAENKDFSFNNELYIYSLKNGTREKIKTKEGYLGGAAWSPDGEKVAYTASDRTYENASHAKLWVYDSTTQTQQCITEGIDAPVGDFSVGDIQQGAGVQSVVWSDNESFYFVISDQGSVSLYFGSINGEVYPALSGSHHVYGFDVHGPSQQVIAAISTAVSPGELHLLHIPSGKNTQLTETNKSWLEEVEAVEPEQIRFKSAGDWEVHGWFMKPAGYREGEKYPLVLNIHGGPHAMYANTFFHEMQVLAAQGYAVLYVNPRGSHGYGQKFVDAVRGDYGGNDYNDLMAAVDYVLEEYGFIDQERLGVTGGSYGGFMTNWIVGHTDRFKAAVTQRSISNWISFYGVSDIGYYFSEWQIQADLNDIDTLWKHSPLAYINQINTPLLIMHSEKDYRCPIEQAEQLYIALKRKEKTAKLVRFPESDHNLSRTGKPNLRLERLNYLTGWFAEYL